MSATTAMRYIRRPVQLAAMALCFVPCTNAQDQQTAGVTYRRDPPLANTLVEHTPPGTEVDVSFANRQAVPIPGPEMLDLKRPRSDYPVLLSPTDFFGRAPKPSMEYIDPFNSSAAVDGNATAPGERPMLKARSMEIRMEPWAQPTLSVAEEVWTTLILLREGEVVFPRSLLIGSPGTVEAQRSAVKESPYIYLRAKRGRTDKSGNYLRTTLDLEVVDKQQQVFVYKFDVRVVPLRHPDYFPTVKADMVDTKLPPRYGSEASRYSDDAQPAAIPPQMVALSRGGAGSDDYFTPGSTQVADGRRFSRADTRRFLPIMIGMAKAYDEATQAGAKGYEARNIMPFSPVTVMPGPNGKPRRVEGKIPAFRNPHDGQTYFVLRSYFFPRYDAVLYDVSVRNTSKETLWWNYSELGIIPGFESSERVEAPTVVSPEFGETTPPGKVNTLWVLVQGRGFLPSTPIRLVFPSRSMEAHTPRVVQPHAQTPPPITPIEDAISIIRPDSTSVWTP